MKVSKTDICLLGGPHISYRTPIKQSNYSSDTEASFLALNLCISNDTVSTKIYDKRDDFDFDIVNFLFLDGDVPRRTSYEVYRPTYLNLLNSPSGASSNLINSSDRY